MSSALSLSPTVPRWKDGVPTLLAVIGVHAALLAAVLVGLHPPKPDPVTPPTLSGVLVVEAPEQVAPPEPQPVVQPRPQPATRPRPAPPVKAPATERSITAPEAPPEPVQPVPVASLPAPPAPAAVAPVAEPVAAPAVALPIANASHLNNPAPVYPPLSRRRGEQGTVHLDLLVLADGTVGDIGLKRSSGFAALDQSALKAVARWRFVPASQGGVPLDWRYVLPVTFDLKR